MSTTPTPYLTGELYMAGDIELAESCDPIPGVVVSITRDVLRAAPTLPMYQQIAIVPVADIAALRARVALLEEKAERYRLTTLRQDARVAELEAALRDAREVLNEYSEDGTHRAARLASERIDKAISRVESATSGLRTGNPLADPVMGGLPRYDGGKLSTPAKHPDTVLLEWLFCNTIIAGPDGHVIDCRDDADAARKQGGAT